MIRPTRSRLGAASATLAIFALTTLTLAQDDPPVFRAETAGAFIWGEDNAAGAVSSSVPDPLTGAAIRQLNHGGIEVSSRGGFELGGLGQSGELVSFTTTIVNNTQSELSVRQAASVDGLIASQLQVVSTKKGLSAKERNQTWELANINCLSGGFLPNEILLSADTSSKASSIHPRQALTFSFIAKDPRYYSILCSVEGCYPKGTVRFIVTVNSTDFVFVWAGRDMAYCGK